MRIANARINSRPRSRELADWTGLEPIFVSKLARDLVRTLQTLLGTEDRSDDPMAQPATLTGRDVGEAEGALTALLTRVLTATNTGITRTQYLALRVLALRGPFPSPAALHDYLASRPQVGLDRVQVAELFRGLEAEGLVAGSAPTTPGPSSSPPKVPPSTPDWRTPSPP